jgi:hypothetical protein
MTDPTAGERRHDRGCAAGITNGAARCQCAEPDAGDVEALTDAEREQLSVALYGRGRPDWMVAGPVMEAVGRILASRLDAVRRKAGDERAEQAWDEAVEAVAWCLDNGEPSAAAALAYVHKGNPHRIARESRL